MEELCRYKINKETDYTITEAMFVGNVRVVANNSIYSVTECYQGGGSVCEKNLNQTLGMIEFKDTICVIENELVQGINSFFYNNEDIQGKYYIVEKFKGNVIFNKIKDDVSTSIEILFDGYTNGKPIDISVLVPIPTITKPNIPNKK